MSKGHRNMDPEPNCLAKCRQKCYSAGDNLLFWKRVQSRFEV